MDPKIEFTPELLIATRLYYMHNNHIHMCLVSKINVIITSRISKRIGVFKQLYDRLINDLQGMYIYTCYYMCCDESGLKFTICRDRNGWYKSHIKKDRMYFSKKELIESL